LQPYNRYKIFNYHGGLHIFYIKKKKKNTKKYHEICIGIIWYNRAVYRKGMWIVYEKYDMIFLMYNIYFIFTIVVLFCVLLYSYSQLRIIYYIWKCTFKGCVFTNYIFWL
jgi:hypothetical protein